MSAWMPPKYRMKLDPKVQFWQAIEYWAATVNFVVGALAWVILLTNGHLRHALPLAWVSLVVVVTAGVTMVVAHLRIMKRRRHLELQRDPDAQGEGS